MKMKSGSHLVAMAIVTIIVLVLNLAYRRNNAIPYKDIISAEATEFKMSIKSSYYEDVFAVRQKHINTVCTAEGRPPPQYLNNSIITNRMRVDPIHNILYCPVEKVASTFWMRTLVAMVSNGQFTSPYTVKINAQQHIPTYQTFSHNNSSLAAVNSLRNSGQSLLVVRDPYTKLFSAYADKLFHPNFLFWKHYGEPIKTMIRHYKNPNSNLVCGNDITFSEFIKFIIYTYEHNIPLNPHFTPIYEHCDPCATKYTYISHVETLKSDFFYILNHWNARWNLHISFQDFDKETALSVARAHAKISHSTMRQFSRKCKIRPFKFLQRTWKFLQISGIISKKFPIPFPDNALARFVTQEDFLKAVQNVLAKQPAWTEVKKQRQEALVQAYHSINDEDMMKLRGILQLDCKYFNYDDKPPELFNKNVQHNDFNYFSEN